MVQKAKIHWYGEHFHELQSLRASYEKLREKLDSREAAVAAERATAHHQQMAEEVVRQLLMELPEGRADQASGGTSLMWLRRALVEEMRRVLDSGGSENASRLAAQAIASQAFGRLDAQNAQQRNATGQSMSIDVLPEPSGDAELSDDSDAAPSQNYEHAAKATTCPALPGWEPQQPLDFRSDPSLPRSALRIPQQSSNGVAAVGGGRRLSGKGYSQEFPDTRFSCKGVGARSPQTRGIHGAVGSPEATPQDFSQQQTAWRVVQRPNSANSFNQFVGEHPAMARTCPELTQFQEFLHSRSLYQHASWAAASARGTAPGFARDDDGARLFGAVGTSVCPMEEPPGLGRNVDWSEHPAMVSSCPEIVPFVADSDGDSGMGDFGMSRTSRPAYPRYAAGRCFQSEDIRFLRSGLPPPHLAPRTAHLANAANFQCGGTPSNGVERGSLGPGATSGLVFNFKALPNQPLPPHGLSLRGGNGSHVEVDAGTTEGSGSFFGKGDAKDSTQRWSL